MPMTKRELVQSAASLLAAGVPGVAAATGPGRFGAAAEVLDRAVATGAVPWAILVVTGPARDLFTHAAGTAYGHVDVLRSATKIATVSAVMTLAHSGALSLDDPVSRFIPAFGSDKAAVRVRHLLAMNSGLPSGLLGFSDEAPLAQAAAIIAAAPLAAEPGARFIYGNLGLTVAGRVAEVVSGRPWDAFFRAALAEPLGLNFVYGPLNTGRLGGGGVTDAASYAKLLRLHLNLGRHGDSRILSADLVRQMQQSNGSVFVNPLPQMSTHGYGMGWWFDEIDGDGRATVVSDAGAWGAYPWIDLRKGHAAFIFVRRRLQDGVALQRQVRPLIEAAITA